jgi:hypothetical protein
MLLCVRRFASLRPVCIPFIKVLTMEVLSPGEESLVIGWSVLGKRRNVFIEAETLVLWSVWIF